MAWPTPQDYNEAIQNPGTSFNDADLVIADPERTALGLPRPVTGNFASVYRLRTGNRDWAVRCFWREYSDMRDRYSAIGKRLSSLGLPYTVGFDYAPQGIKVRGAWYPILKMQWAEGEPLNRWIERHLSEPAALGAIALRWREMVSALDDAGIAHGDLQHGNVLVAGDRLRLVDYDGMFVPALTGKGSHERGHYHYQHPDREGHHFGPTVDRFSAWVIYLSLLAVSRQPSLWTELNGGDECLLLRRQDFLSPGSSQAFQLLSSHPDVEVRSLARSFRAAAESSIERVPSLPRSGLDEGRGYGGRSAAWSGLLSRKSRFEVDEQIFQSRNPPWVLDHLGDVAARFRGDLTRTRVLLSAWMVVFAAAIPLVFLDALPSADAGAIVGALTLAALSIEYGSYRRESDVAVRVGLLRQLHREERMIFKLGVSESLLLRKERRLEARFQRRCRRLDNKKSAIEARSRQEVENAAEVSSESLAILDDWKQRLDVNQRQDMGAALKRRRDRHIQRCLHGASVLSPGPVNVSMTVKIWLWLKGVRNAALVDAERISGMRVLGADTVTAVVAWCVDVDLRARGEAPGAVQPNQAARINARYASVGARIERDREMVRVREARLMRCLEDRTQRRLAPTIARSTEIVATYELESSLVSEHRRRGTDSREAARARVARVRRDLQAYSSLTLPRYITRALR